MIKNKLSFKSENLQVDWLGFNIPGLANQKEVEIIANYLFQNFGFNSTFAFGSDGKQEILFSNLRNKHHVYFRAYKYSDMYWDGIKIDFSGKNATQIYKIIQEQKLDWNIFKLPNLSLSRLDLCYFREIKLTDQKDQCEKLFSDSISKLANRYKKNKFNFDQSTKGYILRIGNRKSSNFYRIYQTKDGLRFELEIKKKLIKEVSNLLFCYDIEQFEETLTKHFYTWSKKVLTLNDYDTDWLIKYFRKNEKPRGSLVTSYLEKHSYTDLFQPYQFFMLLQFFSFSRNQNHSSRLIYSKDYYVIKFKLSEFMSFSGIKNKNQYQRNKCIAFFSNLQKIEPWRIKFSDSYFQSLILFPVLEIFKEGNSWMIKIVLSKQLDQYFYPFSFPSYFLTYKDTYDLRVKLEIIELISTYPLQKVFYTKMFLKQFSVSTKKERQIKQLIVEAFSELQKQKIIQYKFSVVKKSGEIKQVNSLTCLLVGQADKIYFFEKV